MDLSDDDLLCILNFLSINDQKSVRETCWRLYYAVMTRITGLKGRAILKIDFTKEIEFDLLRRSPVPLNISIELPGYTLMTELDLLALLFSPRSQLKEKENLKCKVFTFVDEFKDRIEQVTANGNELQAITNCGCKIFCSEIDNEFLNAILPKLTNPKKIDSR